MATLRKAGLYLFSDVFDKASMFGISGISRSFYSHNKFASSKFYKCLYSTRNFDLINRRYLTDNKAGTGSENVTVASSIAKDILDAKIKDEKSQEKSSNDQDEEEKRKEQENKRRALKFSFISVGVIGMSLSGLLLHRWGSPPVDDNGRPVEDEFSHLPTVEQYLRRFYKEMTVMRKIIKEPSREKLLPDPLSGEYFQPPYTLVLELRDVLVHPEWTYSNGWRFKKRPGVEYLLQHCAPPLFEIVIYTSEQGMTAFHIIEKLDPGGFIWYKLFRDTTNYKDGKHIKELNMLNRDLKKVIMVDWDSDAVSSTRNQLKVPRWNGDMNDDGLTQLADLLRTIAESEVDDVRNVLDYYKEFDDPLAAYDKLKTAAQREEQRLRMIEEEKEKEQAFKTPKSWKPSFFSKW